MTIRMTPSEFLVSCLNIHVFQEKKINKQTENILTWRIVTTIMTSVLYESDFKYK